MGQLATQLIDDWQAAGVESIQLLRLPIGPYSQSGYWGLLDASDDGSGEAGCALMRLLLPPGDATLDSQVNFADFQVLQSHWGLSGQWLQDGDFNGDGTDRRPTWRSSSRTQRASPPAKRPRCRRRAERRRFRRRDIGGYNAGGQHPRR